MLLFVGAAVSIYAVLKLGQILTKRDRGYGQDDPVPVRRKRVRELVVIAVSLVLAVGVTIYHNWWIHRLASREYAHSRICYAQLDTAFHLKTLPKKVDVLRLERSALANRDVAEEHGAMLGMPKKKIDADLTRLKAAFSSRYAGMTEKKNRRQLAALFADVTRCMNDDWAPHGEIFNP